MVNKTALMLIQQFIEENKLKPMKKWSERLSVSRPSYKYLTKLIDSIRSLMDLLSGNDTVKMVESK